MSDNDVRTTKWVTGLVAIVLITLILGGFVSSYLHGFNSAPKIEGDVACMYKTANIEESTTAKEWICEKVK